MVVQREYRLHILPLPLFWCNASTTLIYGVRNQLVYDAKALGFVEGFGLEGFAGFFGRGSGSYTVDPVADSANALDPEQL